MSSPIIFRDNSTCVILGVWLDENPTTYDWTDEIPLGVLLVRTDDLTMWYKSGASPTNWTQVGGGGGVAVEDEGTPVATATTLNFAGSGVVASDAGGGTVDVTITAGGAGVDTSQDDTPVVAPALNLNFLSALKPLGLAITDGGAGSANIEVEMSADTLSNSPGSPAEEIPLTLWAIYLDNEGSAESTADFTLPNPSGVTTEITIVANTSGNFVSVAVDDMAGGAHTFISENDYESITFLSFSGVWYLKSQVGFGG